MLQGVTFPQASDAITRLCRAALAVEDLPGAVRARLLAQLATASADLGALDAAAEHARAALALAQSTGDLRAELDAARAVQMTLAHPDDTAERLRLGELTVARAERLGDPLAAAATLSVAFFGWSVGSTTTRTWMASTTTSAQPSSGPPTPRTSLS
ncbi:hypothetical protein MTF65_02700 [Streptomyces sp. APSN-46.1]|uniref:hypothetical protein n=1 Tax=Streptomyces sp. APSN-46.1 TaxID=2929049 RepID=UPI001FB258AC|nr:hypothetical protein [Streptomyces sp. APSN-46.1]MCJ1676283.1 hypothetical protein [Streptomyces sp. APSN-46.1]